MKRAVGECRIAPGERLDLRRLRSSIPCLYRSKKHYHSLLAKHVEQLSELQSLLYAHNRYALLIILQALDAAGKDGVIKHVMSGVNPQGCQVFSFKHPSATELEHDFLWRTTQHLPERGHIGIFNRSYYEEVLIVRVHPEILAAEHLPDARVDSPTLWEQRFRSINDLESHLHRNGTRIVKFFLHISPREQRRRLLERLEDPSKNWKFSESDVTERRFWRQYLSAYEACISATSTAHAPWYVVPADDKKNARLIISEVLIETLQSLDLRYPRLDRARAGRLRKLKRLLEKRDPD